MPHTQDQPAWTMTSFISELMDYLDSLTITPDNIGAIRRSCFVPWKSSWNGIVRDQTARRELPPAVASSPLPAEPPKTTVGPLPNTAGGEQVITYDYGDRIVCESRKVSVEIPDPPTSEAAKAHGLRRIHRRHYHSEARTTPTPPAAPVGDSWTIAQRVIADWHNVERWHDPSMTPIPAFTGAQEEELTRLIAEAVRAAAPAEPPPNDAHRCPHCGRRMVSEFDEDVGFWRECANCDYREAVSSTPAEPLQPSTVPIPHDARRCPECHELICAWADCISHNAHKPHGKLNATKASVVARLAQQVIATVLGFSDLDDLGALAPDHPNRKYAESEITRIITRHLPGTPHPGFIEAFRNTAIKLHGAYGQLVRTLRLHDGPLEHQGPWEECDWIECEDRRKMITELEAATPLPKSNDAWREWFDRMGDKASAEVVNATADLVTNERLAALVQARVLPSSAPVVATDDVEGDGSMTSSGRLGQAVSIAESREIDLETAQELIYLRGRVATTYWSRYLDGLREAERLSCLAGAIRERITLAEAEARGRNK